ncbi:MAG TPA: DUF1330 domain-containing protein [Halieaceae bacterium]|nr:DUF1330 domain-containing protein [Halieaceae bacterium]|tara:strand:- start:128 stop:535 length:408 start_codon:yes stop_codon:yes gene_type:complete
MINPAPALCRLFALMLCSLPIAAVADPATGETCDEPVIMLVYGEIHDREAFAAYASALAQSGLYDKHGGHYLAISPILEVLEGDPPAGRGMVVSQFPCAAAARAFWHDPAYEAITPLRAGNSEFEVTLLPALAAP